MSTGEYYGIFGFQVSYSSSALFFLSIACVLLKLNETIEGESPHLKSNLNKYHKIIN